MPKSNSSMEQIPSKGKLIDLIISLVFLAFRSKKAFENEELQSARTDARKIMNTAVVCAVNEMLTLNLLHGMPECLYFEMTSNAQNRAELISICWFNRKSGRTLVVKIPAFFLTEKVIHKIEEIAESNYASGASSGHGKRKIDPPTVREVIEAAKTVISPKMIENAVLAVGSEQITTNRQKYLFDPTAAANTGRSYKMSERQIYGIRRELV